MCIIKFLSTGKKKRIFERARYKKEFLSTNFDQQVTQIMIKYDNLIIT